MSLSRLLAAAAVFVLAGCAMTSTQSGSTSAPPQGGMTSAAPAPAPAPAAPKSSAGMNARGDVVDSSKVEAGSGREVKGLGGWDGEVTGRPAANSKFTRLQIGMSMRQVVDLAGPPSDQGAYVTGKAWIPFYFGSDRHRFEMVYKNQGRLIFAGGSLGDYTGGNLIWIIHNPTEVGSR